VTVPALAPLKGEIIAPGEGIALILALHPLSLEHRHVPAPAGLSIAELIAFADARIEGGLRCRLVVRIGDMPISEEHWRRVRPKPGTTVLIRAVAENFGDNFLRSVLSLAVVGLGIFAAGPLAGLLLPGVAGAAGFIGAAITVGGQLLINALFPLANSTPLSADTSRSQTYSIAGGQNQANPFGPIPSILGKIRYTAPLGARSYTEFAGSDQYLRMLVVWGYGPLDISDIKIGETLLSDYEDVEVQTRQGYPDDEPLSLFPGEVLEDDFSVSLTHAAGWQTRTTDTAIDEISLDIVAPNGIVRVDSSGTSQNYTVSIRAEYSPTGAGTWTLLDTLNLTSQSTDAIRKNLRLAVANGQYDVRVMKTSSDYSGSDQVQEEVDWTALRGFRNMPPIAFGKPLAMTALRIRATSQLNGAIDNLNAIVESHMTAFDGTNWIPDAASRNPADAFRWVLQGPATARPQPDSRIDLATLELWWEYCDAQGFNFDMARDFQASIYDTLTDIASAGRAVVLFRNGKWSVAWDQADAPIVQHFTPRNSWGFSGSRTYGQLPHAFRVQFVNAEVGYQQDELIVYDDGYDASNATLFETIEFPGVTDPDIIWKMGRFHIAQARLRPEIYTLSVDVEHIVCTRGDRVLVQHDVPMFGLASGRVKAVDADTNVVTLDEPVTMDGDKSYAIRFRLADGSSLLSAVETVEGVQNAVTLTGGVGQPAPGDLFMFGESGIETVVLRVRSITPDTDLSAKVTFVDDAPAISSADSGTIPPFNSQITIPPATFSDAPVGLKVKEGYQGTGDNIVTGVFFSWAPAPGTKPVSYEAQFANLDGDAIYKAAGTCLAPKAQVFITGYQAGVWNLRVRAIFSDGSASDWAALTGQTLSGGTILAGEPAPGSVTVTALVNELKNRIYNIEDDMQAAIATLQNQIGEQSEYIASVDATSQTMITALTAKSNAAAAQIVTIAKAVITTNSALASLTTTVTANFNQLSAGGILSWEAEAGTDGGYASVTMVVTMSDGVTQVEAGTYTKIVSDGSGGFTSQTISIADKQYWSDDGGTLSQPMTYDADTGLLTVDQLMVNKVTSASGKLTIDGTTANSFGEEYIEITS
jgi:hypothetical protein